MGSRWMGCCWQDRLWLQPLAPLGSAGAPIPSPDSCSPYSLLHTPSTGLPAEPSARHAAAAAAPPPERHPSLQPGRRGLWSRLRRVLTLDFLFDQLDELFEKGDNVDLTVSACPFSSFEYVFCWCCVGSAMGAGGCWLLVAGCSDACMRTDWNEVHAGRLVSSAVLCPEHRIQERLPCPPPCPAAGGCWPAAHAGTSAVAAAHAAPPAPGTAVCAGSPSRGVGSSAAPTATPCGSGSAGRSARSAANRAACGCCQWQRGCRQQQQWWHPRWAEWHPAAAARAAAGAVGRGDMIAGSAASARSVREFLLKFCC